MSFARHGDRPLEAAPFFADLAQAGSDAEAWWLPTKDGTQIRIARLGTGPKGCVLILPGRTEYIEKYGPSGREFEARGFGSVAIDWRGQGLADRLLSDRTKGHVEAFTDYQLDMAALLEALPQIGVTGPKFMAAHSMGGAIGLRSLLMEVDVTAVAFSGPMWGINLGAIQPVAPLIARTARLVGLGTRFAPGTGPIGYTERQAFEGNTLTGDAQMYAWMKSHLAAQPDLSLGGPTLHWLDEALRECRTLMRLPAPNCSVLTVVGSEESIVDGDAVRDYMSRWPGARYDEVPGGQHEIMMETPLLRAAFFDAAAELFETANV